MPASRNTLQPFASPPTSPSMHLPTPQSPADLGHYLSDNAVIPNSPSPSNSQVQSPTTQRLAEQRTAAWLQVNGQTATPESSPHRPRLMDPSMSLSGLHSRTTSHILNESSDTKPSQSSSLSSRESPVPDPVGISRLSSPFIDRSPTSSRNDQPATFGRSRSHSPLLGDSVSLHDSTLLFKSQRPSYSTPPPPHISLQSTDLVALPGDTRDGLSSHFREIEDRRPEYLKRAKRTLMEADLTADADDERNAPVGIVQSPATGRRLKLFQETSEESFEESLMAGGYGLYKTTDWVRQPQPLSIPLSTLNGGSVVALLEQTHDAPPTELDKRKRRRLDAFRTGPLAAERHHTHLQTVHLEGTGRVLMEAPNEEPVTQPRTPPRKRGTTRRRKAATGKENQSSQSVEEPVFRPNWPDSEFPWKLRLDEEADRAKAEEDKRMRCIERFLDEDSDEEDTSDSTMLVDDVALGDDACSAASKGVPDTLHGYSGLFLGDPADARTALLAAAGTRMELVEEPDADAELCLCKGQDDGRELVQCNKCDTWYHLECVGIQDIAELGKEEDPWYCSGCIPRRSSSPDLMETSITSKEPILVPTAEDIRPKQVYDPPFFQPSLQDSPLTWYSSRPPKTPTRANRADDAGFSSASDSSWVNSSKYAPSTPSRGPSHHDPSIHHRIDPSYEESPFDPTSTPSRAIKFGVPFITPKEGWWTGRGVSLFPHLTTPLDASRRSDAGHHLARGDTNSPTRRLRGVEQNHGNSPLPPVTSIRSSFAPPSGMEESPIIRSRGVEKLRYDQD
ncbi:hypothetical protein BDN72DRAFT_953169 [Pluteus cervinus]|uniref:Uncharacterized protein n=1 Tax=Pluteus cervinus TaxID=181527 RepID=A0ACD3BFG3_9AGAR|nr:hypothetical protein BDN72DRAFT_953169 [Pluteus cervinus]